MRENPSSGRPLKSLRKRRPKGKNGRRLLPTFKKSHSSGSLPSCFALDIVAMLVFKLRGGDATALLGGTVGLIMVIVAFGVYGKEGFEKLSDHARAGFMFGVRIFAPVFLIASFFFMGSPGTAKAIFGEGAKGLLFDLGQALANAVPLSRIPVAIVQAIVGGITGLDGSGFSGLPLVGTLARRWVVQPNWMWPPWELWDNTLPSPWVAGTIIPWAVIPAAAITGTDPVEIARRNLWPTLLGIRRGRHRGHLHAVIAKGGSNGNLQKHSLLH